MASGPANKIIELGLEHVVIAARNEGKGLDAIVRACNDWLQREGPAATSVSKSTVKRYLAALTPGTVAAAHEPTVAVENARVAIEFAERLGALDRTVRKWLDEADAAVTPMRGVLWDPYAQEPMPPKEAAESRDDLLTKMRDDVGGDLSEYFSADVLKVLREHIAPVTILVQDWHARKVAASELRGLLKVFADLMQRVHDAEEVRAFQEAFVETIRDVEPEVAAVMLAKLREKRSVRNAAILGAG